MQVGETRQLVGYNKAFGFRGSISTCKPIQLVRFSQHWSNTVTAEFTQDASQELWSCLPPLMVVLLRVGNKKDEKIRNRKSKNRFLIPFIAMRQVRTSLICTRSYVQTDSSTERSTDRQTSSRRRSFSSLRPYVLVQSINRAPFVFWLRINNF